MISELMSAQEHRLHPAGIAVVIVGHVRSVAVVAVAIVAGMGPEIGIPLVGGVLAIACILGVLEWRVTRYAVVDGGLRFRSGLLSRHEVTIPASRISALDTTSGLLQRVFGVVALQVQTAGGGEHAELTLGAVRPAEAERLRRELGHHTDGALRAAPAPMTGGVDAATVGVPQFRRREADVEDAGEVIYTVSFRELLLAGLTSPSAALIGAGFAAVAGPAHQLVNESAALRVRRSVESIFSSAPDIALATFAVLAATLFISVVGTFMAYYGFRITRNPHRLHLRRGLLTERTGTVPLSRVHAVRIVEQPLRQAIGYVSIEAEVAGWASQNETVRTLVPFVRRDELPTLLPRLVPGFEWPEAPLTPLPSRSLRRYVWPPLGASAVLAVALVIAPLGLWRVAVAVAVLVAGLGLGLLRGRDAGWLFDGERLVLRSRRFSRTTVVALSARLQSRETSTSPFQARAALATLGVRLSSRRHVVLRHIEASDAAGLLAALRPTVHRRPADKAPRVA